MSEVRPRLRGGAAPFRVLSVEPLTRLYEEVAFIAYHFHWAHDDIMAMEHSERRRWCAEISQINQKLSGKHSGEKSLDEFL